MTVERVVERAAKPRGAASRVPARLTSLAQVRELARLLSNCFMMNLKLQNAAKRHFVFVECYVVKLLSCVA